MRRDAWRNGIRGPEKSGGCVGELTPAGVLAPEKSRRGSIPRAESSNEIGASIFSLVARRDSPQICHMIDHETDDLSSVTGVIVALAIAGLFWSLVLLVIHNFPA